MRYLAYFSALLLLPQGVRAQTNPVIAADTAADTANWSSEIAEFRKADRLNFPAPGGVVFIGSSSIRMWPNLVRHFPGVNVIRRGLGGSELADVVYRARRLAVAYRPRLVVLYAGDNDLANGRAPEQIFNDFQSFVDIVHKSLPRTRIVWLAIKPSWARVSLLEKMRTTNGLVKAYIDKHPRLTYVDTFPPMLSPSGQPRMELPNPADSLHLNAAGYELWRHLLAPIVSAPANARDEASRKEGLQ